MTSFLQVIAGALITVVLGLSLNRQGKDITLLLGAAVCCMILTVAMVYLEPIVEFIQSLQQLGGLDDSMMSILFKAVGIGLIAEIASLICADSGNGALGKAIHILASAAVLWLSIPMMRSLLELIQKIVGEI